MKQANDQTRLRHMLDASIEACEFISDVTFEEFRQNKLLVNAVVRSLEILGEAAAQISDEFKRCHPEIEWRVLVGMRNRLIHGYFDVDYRVVWQTVHENLPQFIEKVKKAF